MLKLIDKYVVSRKIWPAATRGWKHERDTPVGLSRVRPKMHMEPVLLYRSNASLSLVRPDCVQGNLAHKKAEARRFIKVTHDLSFSGVLVTTAQYTGGS